MNYTEQIEQIVLHLGTEPRLPYTSATLLLLLLLFLLLVQSWTVSKRIK